jgi:cytochrome d ubiquinol oxidase subunit II
MEENLFPLAFAGIIAFGVFMYVLMDGFDLGVGILFPLAPGNDDRDVMMNSVAPIWDGNETWLVLGGAALYGAFPLAYGVLLSGLYLPLLVMLVMLVFRGVAFEFRFKANRSRFLWDIAFSGGSIIATFAQGVALGAFIQGFTVENNAYAGGAFDWLNPFSILTGIALIPGYALLGATWLVLKTQGPLQDWAYETAMRQLVGVVFFMGVVSIGTLYLDTGIIERWFSWPNIAFLAPVPIAVAVSAYALYRSLLRRAELSPFILSMFLFWLGYSGLAISIWPNIIPHHISIWTAASPVETQEFMIWGFVILIPIILSYTAYSYWVFRGKVTVDSGYH